jgi:hypothetical protein
MKTPKIIGIIFWSNYSEASIIKQLFKFMLKSNCDSKSNYESGGFAEALYNRIQKFKKELIRVKHTSVFLETEILVIAVMARQYQDKKRDNGNNIRDYNSDKEDKSLRTFINKIIHSNNLVFSGRNGKKWLKINLVTGDNYYRIRSNIKLKKDQEISISKEHFEYIGNKFKKPEMFEIDADIFLKSIESLLRNYANIESPNNFKQWIDNYREGLNEYLQKLENESGNFRINEYRDMLKTKAEHKNAEFFNGIVSSWTIDNIPEEIKTKKIDICIKKDKSNKGGNYFIKNQTVTVGHLVEQFDILLTSTKRLIDNNGKEFYLFEWDVCLGLSRKENIFKKYPCGFYVEDFFKFFEKSSLDKNFKMIIP